MIRNNSTLTKLNMVDVKCSLFICLLLFVLAFNDAKAQQNNSEMEQNGFCKFQRQNTATLTKIWHFCKRQTHCFEKC